MDKSIEALNEKIRKESAFVDALRTEVGKVIVGQKYLVERLLMGLLSNGHVLIEGVPGLAKTLTVKTLAAIQTHFTGSSSRRTCFPADLIGTLDLQSAEGGVHDPRKVRFSPTSMLADEINRAPAKVQSALLEAMQEQAGDDRRHDLSRWTNRFSCSPRRTRSNRKAPIRCRRPRSTASCSS